MVAVKQAADNLSYAYSKFDIAVAHASSSTLKRVGFIALVGVFILLTEIVGLKYLQHQVNAGAKARAAEQELVLEVVLYKSALDAVNSCIEAIREKSVDREWYCSAALDGYKTRSTNQPRGRVAEVAKRFAYPAMRDDISHYIRLVEAKRTENRPRTTDEDLLELLLSKAFGGFWVLLSAAILAGVIYRLYTVPRLRYPSIDGTGNA